MEITCQRVYVTSGSIKCGEFLDLLKTGHILKDSAPWIKEVASDLVRTTTINKIFTFVLCHIGDRHGTVHTVQIKEIAVTKSSHSLPPVAGGPSV